MKMRSDFVTNSSSSSFVAVNAKNDVLLEILKKHEEYLEEIWCWFNEDKEGFSLNMDEAYMEFPGSKDDIITALVSTFYPDYYSFIEEDYDEEDFEDEEGGFEIAKDIWDHREEIMDAMEEIELIYSESGWQGDSDSRYYKDNYSKERLAEIYAEIAASKGCEVEDVDDEDFDEYVGDKISIDENRMKYSKETDKCEFSCDFYLE